MCKEQLTQAGDKRMTRILTFATATLAAVTFAGAQTPTQPPSSDPSSPRPAVQSSQSGNTITVSGCLKEGVSAGSFILADASAIAAPMQQAADREAQPGAVGTSGTAKTYALAAKADDLGKHVNHKMEVTGTVSTQRTAASSSTGSGAGQEGATTQPGTAAKAGAAAQPIEILTVQSVKMIAASCS
jgi:hypothetical protein